jgi:hypothetical protein
MTNIFKGSLILAGLNAKTAKSDAASDYATAIMYMSPADLAGGKTVCAFADKAGCREGCLNLSGQGVFNSVQQARIRKTRMYLDKRDAFLTALWTDLTKFAAWCDKRGKKPAVRLNGTSDIPYERIERGGDTVFSAFPQIQFYDYTKVYSRVSRALPLNYSLVLSYSEAHPDFAQKVLRAADSSGVNIAAVYRDRAAQARAIECGDARFGNRRIVDGDQTDLRFLDPAGVVVALYAKGKARADRSGFVLNIA